MEHVGRFSKEASVGSGTEFSVIIRREEFVHTEVLFVGSGFHYFGFICSKESGISGVRVRCGTLHLFIIGIRSIPVFLIGGFSVRGILANRGIHFIFTSFTFRGGGGGVAGSGRHGRVNRAGRTGDGDGVLVRWIQ
mgnify:CR=1 FL=1